MQVAEALDALANGARANENLLDLSIKVRRCTNIYICIYTKSIYLYPYLFLCLFLYLHLYLYLYLSIYKFVS